MSRWWIGIVFTVILCATAFALVCYYLPVQRGYVECGPGSRARC